MSEFKRYLGTQWIAILALLTTSMGAIYELGFKAQAYTRDIEANRTGISQIWKVLDDHGKASLANRDDINKLMWETGERRQTINNIQLDVKNIDASIRLMEKRMEVILELLKPKHLN